MKREFSLLFAFLLFTLCSITFLSQSLEANASDRSVVYTQIERDAGIDLFGTQIPYNVTINGVRSSGTFTLSSASVNSCSALNIVSNDVFNSPSNVTSYVWLLYKARVSGSVFCDWSIDVPVYFSDSARGAFAISGSGLGSADSDNLIASYPDNYFNSFHSLSMNSAADASLANYYGYFTFYLRDTDNYNYYYTFRPIPYDFSGGQQIETVNFEHIKSSSEGNVFFAIGLPYVYGNVSQGIQTTTSTSDSSSSGTDINVNVDMTETNGLLGQIKQILQGIVDGIKNLFIPSDEALEAFSDDMDDLIQDHLGGLYEAMDIINGIWTQFQNVTAKSEIYIPAVSVPLAGATLNLGDWHVPLKVQGMPAVLYEGIAWIIDFLAVASFLRMCRTKLEIFLNPDSEVVSNDN